MYQIVNLNLKLAHTTGINLKTSIQCRRKDGHYVYRCECIALCSVSIDSFMMIVQH